MTNITRLDRILDERDGLCYKLEDFCRYINGHQPSNLDLMEMIEDEYVNTPRSTINAAYLVAITSMSTSNISPPT